MANLEVNNIRYTTSNVVVICTAVVQLVTMWFLMGGKITTVNNRVDLLEQKILYNERQISANRYDINDVVQHNALQDLAIRTFANYMGIKPEEPQVPKRK